MIKGLPLNLTAETYNASRFLTIGVCSDNCSAIWIRASLFHVFCNRKSIPEEQRAPLAIIASSFIASLTGTYSGSTVS